MYNVAMYVERCIRSLENQDIQGDEYELICINDGSPDNCREIIENLQLEFKNITLINQENQGVSMARNNGIEKASGKFILFIDPDDYVEANCFSRILNSTELHQAQASFLGFTILNTGGDIRRSILMEEYKDTVFSGTEAYFIARGDGRSDPDRIWAVLFETDFIKQNKLLYLADVPYLEDGELIARILCLAKRCIFDGHSFYWRTTRPGSATNSRLFSSEKAIRGFTKAAVNLRDFRNTLTLSKEQKEFLNQPVVKFVALSVASVSHLSGFKMLFKVKSILRKNNLNRLELKGCDKLYTRLGSLYNISIFILFIYLISKHALWVIRNSIRKIFIHPKSSSKLL